MSRRFVFSTCIFLLSFVTGCNYAKRGASFSGYFGSPEKAITLAASPQRYIAERHKIDIVTPESALQSAWESTIAFCGTIQCELVSSSITARTDDSLPAGTISLRVAPGDLDKLLGSVAKLGKLAQHTTEREDKTTQVVDTDAQIRNLTAFRDNLRAMLTRQSATVRDLVEIEKQLTDTQAELDSETTQRKILANETEKIAVEIAFRVERRGASAGGFAQIWHALRESGSILADSTASLITTVVAIIPWLIVAVPLFLVLRKAWRNWKRRRSGGSASSSVAGIT